MVRASRCWLCQLARQRTARGGGIVVKEMAQSHSPSEAGSIQSDGEIVVWTTGASDFAFPKGGAAQDGEAQVSTASSPRPRLSRGATRLTSIGATIRGDSSPAPSRAAAPSSSGSCPGRGRTSVRDALRRRARLLAEPRRCVHRQDVDRDTRRHVRAYARGVGPHLPRGGPRRPPLLRRHGSARDRPVSASRAFDESQSHLPSCAPFACARDAELRLSQSPLQSSHHLG